MTVLHWTDDGADEDNSDPWHLAIISCPNNRRVRPYLKNPRMHQPTNAQTIVTSNGLLAKSTKLALITQDIECGLPHTRPGKICLPNTQPSRKLLVHELVHIWQRQEPDKWNEWLSMAWNCLPITTPDANIRDKLMERFNPDTFYAGWYAYQIEPHRCILPLPILKSTASSITDTEVKFYNVQGRKGINQNTPIAPQIPRIPIGLHGHQLEHPFETAAYVIAQWYKNGQNGQTLPLDDTLITTITPDEITRQIGSLQINASKSFQK